MANQTSSSTTKQSIIDYYDQTQFDYSVAWTGKVDKAVHFGFYDATARTHREALLNTNRVLAKWAALEGGQRVLDAGCGQGGSCFWMHQQLDVETVGIAPVASQIAVCRANAAELGLASKATFEVADFCQMPFADASFDVVWACESVCHAQKKRAFYQEAYRVLKPGGRLVLAEYLRSARPLAAKEEQLLLQWLNAWAIADIDTAQEHHAHATDSGFRQLQIIDYTQHTWISLKNLHKISKRWLWIGKLLRALNIRSSVQHANQLGGIDQFKALQQGLWFYSVIVAHK